MAELETILAWVTDAYECLIAMAQTKELTAIAMYTGLFTALVGAISAVLNRLLQQKHLKRRAPGAPKTPAVIEPITPYSGLYQEAHRRIDDFIAEYTKSELGIVPFGGRDEEMKILTAWFTNTAPDAPPRFAMAAPTGRGKSALVVNWLNELEENSILANGNWKLIFVPISIRMDTNDPAFYFRIIAEKLAPLAGHKLQQPAGDAAAYYADMVSSCLSTISEAGDSAPKKILLVLDGLDESLSEFPATVFPNVLSAHIKILVTARTRPGEETSEGWVTHLGWKSLRHAALDLKKLDDAAISDVLIKLGAPTDIIGENPKLAACRT